ncbi:MAG: glycosyltransferase family protein [Pirellulaceae bacterium]
MKTVAVIQARMGSDRLPGKVLRKIGGKPMLEWVVSRTMRSELIDTVCVATTDQPMDHYVAQYCEQRSWDFVRGSETNVLSRFLLAADTYGADRIVRITSDCPFIDPAIVDETIELLDRNPTWDYACNFLPVRHFPRGLDVEVFHVRALRELNRIATNPAHREHVTLGFYEKPNQFRVGGNTAGIDLSNHRWTVDTYEDLALANEIAAHFPAQDFGWHQILDVVERHPKISQINVHVNQKAA